MIEEPRAGIPGLTATGAFVRLADITFMREPWDPKLSTWYGIRGPRLIIVRPVIEHDGDSGQQYEPTPAIIWAAMNDLAELTLLTGREMRTAIRQFAQRYGLPTLDCDYLHHLVPPPEVPRFIVPWLKDHLGALGVPLWLVHHEALELRETLTLYQAVVTDDARSVRAWYRRHRPGRILLHADWEGAWADLSERLDRYASLLSWTVDTGGQYPPARTPGGLFDLPPRGRLRAPTLLGMIYGLVAQIVTGQQPLLACPGCGTFFVPQRSNQTYCTKYCSGAARSRKFRARERTNGSQTGAATQDDV